MKKLFLGLLVVSALASCQKDEHRAVVDNSRAPQTERMTLLEQKKADQKPKKDPSRIERAFQMLALATI